MERRRFILLGVALGTAGLAGCPTDGDQAGDEATAGPSTPATTRGASETVDEDCDEGVTRTYDPDAECPGYRLDDVVVFLDRADLSEVRLEIRPEDAEVPVFEETFDSPDGIIRIQDPITSGGTHEVRVAVDGGSPAWYTWNVPQSEVETDAYGLRIYLKTTDIEFSEVVQ